ncbi:MAG: hypothetical protein HXY21_08345 [Parvularculaceae bacterium]|nr:hypothetical protein [Parvularculaceae bacterium]
MKPLHVAVSALLALSGALHAGLATPYLYDYINHDAVWFVSGGMLAVTAGLASLAAALAKSPRRAVSFAAFVGCAGVLLMATALTQASVFLIRSPLVIAYLILSSLAGAFALRNLIRG